MYKFTVNDASLIDLDRVLAEQHADGVNVSLLTSENGGKWLLCHNSFLAKFKAADGLKLGWAVLSPNWGWERPYTEYQTQGFEITPGFTTQKLRHGRVYPVCDVAEAKAQLAAARRSLRRIVVKVHDM